MGIIKQLSQTKQFGKDIKRMSKRGKSLPKIKSIVTLLAEGIDLPEKNNDHALTGEWNGSRDCHVEPDWVLIYTTSKESLRLERTGSHSDLFK